ncbi:MAG: sigma-70 family RNA polymerase sigma factor [Desulfobacteraceae bacterium]|nr:sigma-70 family RNA polymerase sigma factor [Desulfobacteraceae bacterium]MBC2756136.1 sigma-70 family RNA polymerase sigma factor [Desulfobacteraceae bacterium]
MEFDLERLTRGHDKDWKIFSDRVFPLIYSAVRKILSSRVAVIREPDIRDVVQDVFTILIKDDYRALKSYQPQKASMSTWLTTIAIRTAIKFAKQQKPASQSLDLESINIPAPQIKQTTSIDIPEDLLTPRQMLILHMFIDREMDVKEIAGTLNVSPQTVRSTRHKAVKRLRRHLGVSI